MMVVTSERLLKYLGAARLELLLRVAEHAARLSYSTYLAGGVVRDLLLDRSCKDIDLLVEGDAVSLARLMAKERGGTVTVHAAFGTAQWSLDALKGAPEVLHFVTARTEIYPAPAALPIVRPGGVTQDLERRDFSINAMAIRLDEVGRGELLDPSGGEADLRAGVIRTLHAGSYVDDPTRMYRAVRYERRLAFRQNDATLAQLAAGRPHVPHLSGERVRHELDLILAERNPAAMLGRLEELELLRAIHPALALDQGAALRLQTALLQENTVGAVAPTIAVLWILWLMGLAPDMVQSVSSRLALDGGLRKALRVATELREQTPSFATMRPSAIAAALRASPGLALAALAIAAGPGENLFRRYLDEWRSVAPTTTGADLASLGLDPGPVFGEIIEQLRAAWIDGEVDSVEAERELLSMILARLPTSRGPRSA